jgi:hypothetical protein
LHGAPTACGNSFDKKVDIDACAQPDRHSLRRTGDMQSDEQVVDELGFRGRSKTTEIDDLPDAMARDRLYGVRRLFIAAQKNRSLLLGHHARCGANLSVEKDSASRGKRRHIAFFDSNRMGSEFNDDLAKSGGL